MFRPASSSRLTLVCLSLLSRSATSDQLPDSTQCSGQQLRHISSNQQMALNVKLLERIKSMGHARIQDEAKVSSILQTLLDGGNNQLQVIVFENQLVC